MAFYGSREKLATVGSHIREMAKALGEREEGGVWRADRDAPMSETECNWERRVAGAR